MRAIMNIAQKLYNLLCSARLLHYILPIIMVYLVIGTVAQKYIGLYQATQIYFSAPVLWVFDFIPIPGMPVFMAILLVNIIFKIFVGSPWRWQNSGIIITHIGMMLLLLGGLFTALFSTEGYIALSKSSISNIVSDYHEREFVILDGDNQIIKSFNRDNIKQGDLINLSNLPFSIEIINSCRNCKISARQDKTKNHKGMAKHMVLSPDKLKNNDEENMSGIIFQIKHKDVHDIFVVIEDIQRYPLITINGKNYKFALRKKHRQLPFSIELLDFKKETYAGTQMAKSYQSTILIKDGNTQWESVISMNQPLRYKGYSLFQSSFAKTPDGDISVLAVVWNAGRSFPYIAGITVAIGLLLHLLLRLRKSNANLNSLTKTKEKLKASNGALQECHLKNNNRYKKAIILLCLLFLNMAGANNVIAQDDNFKMDSKYLAQIPILHEGRIKPLDSFARLQLKKFSSKENNAISWLIGTLFDPARAENRPVLKVSNPEIIALLELKKRKSRLYSYNEISKALAPKQKIILGIIETEEENWTPQQHELVTLQENMVTLQNLLSSLTMFIPLSIILPEGNDYPEELKPYIGKPITYMEALSFQDDLQNTLKNIIAEKGNNIDEYTNFEQVMAHLSFSLNILEQSSINSEILKVIPSNNKIDWLSPWQVVGNDLEINQIFKLWQKLSFAYHSEDINLWNETALKLYQANSNIENVRLNALHAEYLYNSYNPFYISFILFLLAVSVLTARIFVNKTAFDKITVFLLSIALITQIIGIAARIYILDRPPVSTVYETIIFVSLVTTFYALFAYIKDRKIMWLWLGTALGCILGVLGFSHSADGDSFVVLAAVLNTNFWLITHVICITIAYGFCALTSLLAHYALLQKIWDIKDRALAKNILTSALFALFFATIGTVLGGIWADQSWGRFWGWDPKENGALLIVLWLVWALHGRVSGQMSNVIFLCALSYLSVILALSWFGVNLLGVGLHSYGFTKSTTLYLAIFIIIETIIVIGAALIANKTANRKNKNA